MTSSAWLAMLRLAGFPCTVSPTHNMEGGRDEEREPSARGRWRREERERRE